MAENLKNIGFGFNRFDDLLSVNTKRDKKSDRTRQHKPFDKVLSTSISPEKKTILYSHLGY